MSRAVAVAVAAAEAEESRAVKVKETTVMPSLYISGSSWQTGSRDQTTPYSAYPAFEQDSGPLQINSQQPSSRE